MRKTMVLFVSLFVVSCFAGDKGEAKKVWTSEEMNAVLYGNSGTRTWTIAVPNLDGKSTITFKKVSETEGVMTFGNGKKLVLKYTVSNAKPAMGSGDAFDMMLECKEEPYAKAGKPNFVLFFHNEKQIYMNGSWGVNYLPTDYPKNYLKQMQLQRENARFTLNAENTK